MLKKKQRRKAYSILLAFIIWVSSFSSFSILPVQAATSGAEIIAEAKKYVGNPYVWGGESLTNGCDCSHFVYLILKNTGNYSGGYMQSWYWNNVGTPVASLSEAVAGDVIVWSGHVAFYDGAGQLVEAQSKNTGITSTRNAQAAINGSSHRFLGIRRFTDITSSTAPAVSGGSSNGGWFIRSKNGVVKRLVQLLLGWNFNFGSDSDTQNTGNNSVNVESFIAKVDEIAKRARANGWVYGNSTTTPPSQDRVSSCDRLAALALWELGYTDQKPGGETVGSMTDYFRAHGFTEITSPSDVKRGDIVLVGTSSAPCQHAFVVTDYNPSTGLCSKYDFGSLQRIRSVQPFTNVQLNEWAYQGRSFTRAFRLPSTGGLQNTSHTATGVTYTNKTFYGNCRITHYCNCSKCCGDWAGGNTASGTTPTTNRTVATGSDLAFGTKLLINGQEYVVEDRGVGSYQIDIYVGSHSEALQKGLYYTDVYIIN